MPAPPKAPSKAPPKAPHAQASSPVTVDAKSFSFGKSLSLGEAICLYGEGGIGKTSATSLAPNPGIIDLNRGSKEIAGFANRVISGVETFDDLLAALRSGAWNDKKTVVVDSLTEIQELVVAWVCENIKHERGHNCERIEDFGYGKGYTHMDGIFRRLLVELDNHRREGRHVIVVAHIDDTKKPNPAGDDYLEYVPKAHKLIRSSLRDWCDHLFFIDYDTAVKEGKAIGSGSRTIYCQKRAHFWAKSRTLANPIPYEKGSDEVWKQLFAKA